MECPLVKYTPYVPLGLKLSVVGIRSRVVSLSVKVEICLIDTIKHGWTFMAVSCAAILRRRAVGRSTQASKQASKHDIAIPSTELPMALFTQTAGGTPCLILVSRVRGACIRAWQLAPADTYVLMRGGPPSLTPTPHHGTGKAGGRREAGMFMDRGRRAGNSAGSGSAVRGIPNNTQRT